LTLYLCIQTKVKVLFNAKLSGRPTVPNLELIRKHLLEEGQIAKTELVRLIKDATVVFSKATC